MLDTKVRGTLKWEDEWELLMSQCYYSQAGTRSETCLLMEKLAEMVLKKHSASKDNEYITMS